MHCRPSLETHCLHLCHELRSRDVEIRHVAADLEPVDILCQPAIADFGPSDNTHDDQKHMFNFVSPCRFRTGTSPICLTQRSQPIGYWIHPLDSRPQFCPQYHAFYFIETVLTVSKLALLFEWDVGEGLMVYEYAFRSV